MEWALFQQRVGKRSARRSDGIEFSELMEHFKTLPPETDEERAEREKKIAEHARLERLAKFRNICPPEFGQKINRSLLKNAAAFDQMTAWDGKFPGPIATGGTGGSKSRAAWSILGRLHVTEQRSFAWFPVKRLVAELNRYESKNLADEFWRMNKNFNVLFVDDLDKFNAQFESEGAALFQFYDWIYREHIPCITTTNKSRVWWTKLMGDAFARRLFEDAHFEVKF